MNTLRHVCSLMLGISLALATFGRADAFASDEEAPPELRGILFLSGSRQFALSTPGGAESGWAVIGDTFAGWKLTEFREEGEALVVSRGDRSAELHLASSQVLEADNEKAARAEAEALMEKMNFEEMFEKMIEQQKAAAVKMTRQMVGGMGHDGPSADEMAEFQGRVMDVMWSEMNSKQMAADMAGIYSEIFTRSELRGLSEFYGTPAGRAMIDKQPEIQARTMEIIQPRMMAAMPRIQRISEEFARQQRERRAAEAAPPAPAP